MVDGRFNDDVRVNFPIKPHGDNENPANKPKHVANPLTTNPNSGNSGVGSDIPPASGNAADLNSNTSPKTPPYLGSGSGDTNISSTPTPEATLRQPTPTTPPLDQSGAGYPSAALTELTQPSFTPPPLPLDPNTPYGNTTAIPNPSLEIQNEIINQGKPVGWALSSSLFSVYAQSQNSLEAVSNSDTLLNNTTLNGETQTFGNITPTDIQPLYTAIDNNTGNIAFLNLNRDTSLTVTDLNGINTVKSDISNPVLMNRLNVPVTIPDINATISQTTSNTTSTTIDSIGLTPLSNPNNSNALNQQQALVNNNPLNAGLEASYNAQANQIIRTGIETNAILNPNLTRVNNNNEIASATERTSLTYSSSNPNQQPLAATPLMNNLINSLNITPKSPLTNLTDALNTITNSQLPLTGLNNGLPIANDLSPLNPNNISGLSPLSPNNIANTMHNLVENTVNFILGRPNDFVDSSTGISALSASLIFTLQTSPIKIIAWLNSFKLASFWLAPNSYVKSALILGLLFQFLNPLSALAYKEGDFPGVGNETDWQEAKKIFNKGNDSHGAEACNYYLKAISIYPYEAMFWSNLGLETKDKNKAIEYYQKAIDLNPDFVKPYISLGVTCKELDRHEEAINCYQKALKLEPNNGHLYDGIGNEYLALKKYNEAMPYFRKLIELNPEWEDGYNNLGCCYDGIKNFSKAIELYKQALLINPIDWILNDNIGLDLYRIGKIKEGLLYRDKALELAKSKEDKTTIIKDFENAKAGIYQ